MRKFIIENGVLRDFDDNDKSLVKATEPLKGGDGEHYRGVKSVVVSTNDVVLFLEAYEYGKEQFNKFMMVNAKYDSWKTFEKPIELIDDVADDSVKVIVNYKNGDKKIIEPKAKPASVSKEVKAATVKAEVETTTELVKEDNSMNNMITLAPAELNALLTAARSSVVDTTSQIIYRDREVVPADYEQIKKDLESARKTAATWQSKAAEFEKQIAELKAQIAASVKEVSATSFVAETSAAVSAVPASASSAVPASASSAVPASAPAAAPASAPAAAPVANPVLEEMEKKQAEVEAKKKRGKEEEKACEAILKKAGFDGLSINRLHKRTIPEAAFVAVCKSFGAEKTAEACLYVVRNENGEFEPATIDLFEKFSILPF